MSSPDDMGPGDAGADDDTDQPAALSPEQVHHLLQRQLHALTMEIAHVLGFLAPHLAGPEAWALAQKTASEQMSAEGIPMIVNSIVDTDAVAKHPTIHFFVTDPNKVQVEMKAPKRLEQVREVMTAANSAVILAMLFSPQARAVLRAFGFHYHFGSSQTPVAGRIVLSS